MKDLISFIGQTDSKSRKMHDVVINTAELVSKREATERTVKSLDSTYAKSDL